MTMLSVLWVCLAGIYIINIFHHVVFLGMISPVGFYYITTVFQPKRYAYDNSNYALLFSQSIGFCYNDGIHIARNIYCCKFKSIRFF